jgi:hypothetical protein
MRILWTAALVALVTLIASAPRTHATVGSDAPHLLATLISALNAGDVDAAVSLFADDALAQPASQSREVFSGRTEIRVWIERLVSGHIWAELAPSYTGSAAEVTWSTNVWLDGWRDLGVAPAELLVHVTVRSGLISGLDSNLAPDSAERVAAGTAARDLVNQLLAVLNAGDLDAAIALFAANIEIEGALGDRIHGIEEARAYYARLIAGNLALTPAPAHWIVSGDRVSGSYGLSVESLRALGVTSAETLGDFYIRDGRITRIVARFTPGTAAAIAARR